jgi:tripartite-type tricarboxylate transporter receptor subunit TctC
MGMSDSTKGAHVYKLIFKVLAVGSLLIADAGAQAQGFPSHPIRLVVPAPAGVSPDVVARIIGEPLGRALGQPVLVENRPGASGMIGAQAAAQAEGDGYTLLFGWTAMMAMNPHLYSNARVNTHTDFRPVAHLVNSPFVLTASPLSTFNNVNELVAQAKAKPGSINYASQGPASHSRIATELISQRMGVTLNHISYTNSPLTELISGQVQLYLDPLGTAAPLVTAGKVKALAVSSAMRTSQLPNVPTLSETLPGFSTVSTLGIYAPKKTPDAVVNQLSRELVKIMKDPAIRKRLADMGYEPVGGSAEEFAPKVQEDYNLWGGVIRAIGVKLD